MLNRAELLHIIRAVATITNEMNFVIVGSTAVLLTSKNIPAAMLNTSEVDVYSPDSEDEQAFSDLVEGSIGSESQFDKTFSYFADGASSKTAIMPTDWAIRAKTVDGLGLPGVKVIVPDINDIAISKMMAWRDKDKDWLQAGVRSKILAPNQMRENLPLLPVTDVSPAEIDRRMAMVASYGGVS